MLWHPISRTKPALNAGAGDQRGVTIRPMITAIGSVLFAGGADAQPVVTAQFSDGNNQRLFNNPRGPCPPTNGDRPHPSFGQWMSRTREFAA